MQMKPFHIALALLIAMVWGCNFVAAKAAVGHFPTFMLLSMRVIAVTLLLFPFLRKPTLSIKKAFYVSLTLAVFHFGLSYAALERGLDVTVAAVVDQMRVPFAVILGYFLFRETMDRKGSFGLMVALVGTFIIAGSPNVINNVLAFWMLIGSAAAWAFYNIQVKNLGRVNVFSLIAWVSLLSIPQLLLLSFLFENNQIQLLLSAPPQAVISVLYIVIGATIFAHGCWYFLLRTYAINQVVPYTLLVPVFGMMAGVMFLDEILTWELGLGSILIIFGVTIVIWRKPKAAKGGDAT